LNLPFTIPQFLILQGAARANNGPITEGHSHIREANTGGEAVAKKAVTKKLFKKTRI
jgi:hypothetical protein